jgi:hypothetical protein
MGNTNRKDFHKWVEDGKKVKVTFRGMSMTFASKLANRMSLWDMCEYMILDELQSFWDGELDLKKTNIYHKKEDELINECKIEFLN